jgi:hypothetical protein
VLNGRKRRKPSETKAKDKMAGTAESHVGLVVSCNVNEKFLRSAAGRDD